MGALKGKKNGSQNLWRRMEDLYEEHNLKKNIAMKAEIGQGNV